MVKTKGYALTDENGNITGAGMQYGGMYSYNKAIPFNITIANTYHAFCLVTAGDIVAGMLNGWTFNAGRVVDADITSEANPSGAVLQINCSAAHGLSTGDLVVLGNMNNAGHNKPTRITFVSTTAFTCDDIAYVAGAGASAGTVTMPAFLKASTGSDGNYFCSVNIDGTAAGVNKDWKWELNNEITPQDNIVTERNSTGTLAAMSVNGHVSVVAGNRIWLSGKNISDATDYTIKNYNLNLHKIG